MDLEELVSLELTSAWLSAEVIVIIDQASTFVT